MLRPLGRTLALFAACVALLLNSPAHASYARDVWKPELPAAAVSEQLNGVACGFFGAGLNCNSAGVKDAFEQSSFERVSPSLELFETWYNKNARPVLDFVNEPVRNLRLEVEEALRSPSKAFVPDGDVPAEKQTSLERQLCESRGGSRLYCQKTHPLPWDATSRALESQLSCPGNSSVSLDRYSVPTSTQAAAVLYLPYIDQELDDVMLVANISRALLPVFQKNHRTFNTVRFQRFIAVDGVALVFPAVAARNIRRAYEGNDALNDLRESPSFTHSSCTRQVVFVLDASSKSAQFDLHHRSEAMIFRIFRLLNQYDQVQLIFTSSSYQAMQLGDGVGFVVADELAFSILQTKLSHVLRSGSLSLDSGVSLALDLLRLPPAQHSSCVKKFLIVLSSDEASLLPATVERHVSLENERDGAGNPLQSYFILFSFDSEGQSELAGTFCSKKMIHRSIPRMQPATYKGLDRLNSVSDGNGFYSDAAFGVMRYCTFLFELLAVDGAGPSSAADLGKVVWSPPFYDGAAAPGSLIFTTSTPVFSVSSGVSRFRGVVEVDHVFFTYPSARGVLVSSSNASVVSILNKLPTFLGARVSVALTALGVGMSFVEASFLMKLNALALPLQPQFSEVVCGQLNQSSNIFKDFNSYRTSASLAAWLQWGDANGIEQRTFVDVILKSPLVSGNVPVSSVGNATQSLFFRHAESATIVFLRKHPLFSGQMVIPTQASFSKNCSSSGAACRAATDGLLFASNASTQAGFILSPRSFHCPLCARDAALSQNRDAIFSKLAKYVAGQSDAYDTSDLGLLPAASAELNILASLKNTLLKATLPRADISAASVTGINGVTFLVNRVADELLKSTAFSDYTHNDWFRDATSRPGVMHISLDPASDSSQPDTFLLIVSIGIVVQPQGVHLISGDSPTKGLAAVAHLHVRASWLMSALTSALLQRDARHICMTGAGVCAIVNSRGFIVASTASNKVIYQHVETMYPLLAQALLDQNVFVRDWSNRFGFSLASDRHVRVDSGVAATWSLNSTGPWKFRMFFADSLFSVSIATLLGVSAVLLTAIPRNPLNSNAHDLELPLLKPVAAPETVKGATLSPRIVPNVTEIDSHSSALVTFLQEKICEAGEPKWLLGVSVGVGMAVLLLIIVVTLHRFRIFQKLMAYLFQRKSSIAPVLNSPTTELNRYQFRLCSPNDFPVQKSILRCVTVFQEAFSILEAQIVAFNTFSVSKRIIADDIDGQRIKIQNYLEVLKKQRTLLHERIVSRMCVLRCFSIFCSSISAL